MRWKKLGLIFSPSSNYPWMFSHAQLPLPLLIKDDIYRIYFATRDDRNRSHIAYVELDVNYPTEILNVSQSPVLSPGPIGFFDQDGILPSCLVKHDDKLWLYITGWIRGEKPPLFYTSIGLAVSDDNGRTFERVFHAPIMGRSEFDPCFVASPYVILDAGLWRMWYVSCIKWVVYNGNYISNYHIKYAESDNPVSWVRRGMVALDLRNGERNIARPCVIYENQIYKMWYPVNSGHGYRVGYAESNDGYKWIRKDKEAGIDTGKNCWDSEAISYPFVFVHKNKKYMLYNGNEYGRYGFGLAKEVRNS